MNTWPCGTPKSTNNAFDIPPSRYYRKDRAAHPATKTRDYISASVVCDTKAERLALRKAAIAKYEAEILSVNRNTHLGAHGGRTKGQKAPR